MPAMKSTASEYNNCRHQRNCGEEWTRLTSVEQRYLRTMRQVRYTCDRKTCNRCNITLSRLPPPDNKSNDSGLSDCGESMSSASSSYRSCRHHHVNSPSRNRHRRHRRYHHRYHHSSSNGENGRRVAKESTEQQQDRNILSNQSAYSVSNFKDDHRAPANQSLLTPLPNQYIIHMKVV